MVWREEAGQLLSPSLMAAACIMSRSTVPACREREGAGTVVGGGTGLYLAQASLCWGQADLWHEELQ